MNSRFFTFRYMRLGNIKVNGIKDNDPIKFTKSPRNGSMAAVKLFTVKNNERRMKRIKQLCREKAFSSW